MPRWTAEQLKTLVAHGSVEGKSKNTTRRKLVALGLVEPKYRVRRHKKRNWSPEELEILLDKKKDAVIPGRCRHSILSKLNHLGFKTNEARRPWSREENELLRKLLDQGGTALSIAKILPHSRNSIQKKICRFGRAKKTKQNKLPAETRLQLIRFLEQNWKGKTPKDLAELWNRGRNQKIDQKNVARLLAKIELKIPYGEVQRINKLRKKEALIRLQPLPPKQLDEALRTARVRTMARRVQKNRDIWTGMPLGEQELAELAE